MKTKRFSPKKKEGQGAKVNSITEEIERGLNPVPEMTSLGGKSMKTTANNISPEMIGPAVDMEGGGKKPHGERKAHTTEGALTKVEMAIHPEEDREKEMITEEMTEVTQETDGEEIEDDPIVDTGQDTVQEKLLQMR